MEQKNLSELTNEELLLEAKEMKSFFITNAFISGFLAGILFISVYFSAYNLSLLIPLFLIYKLTNDPRIKKQKK